MTTSPHRVAVRYLQRTPTDNVADITFAVRVDANEVWATANHPRLGRVGHAKLEPVNLQDDLDGGLGWGDERDGTEIGPTVKNLLTFRDNLRNPDLSVYGVANTWVDRRFHGEAVGQRLYLIAIAKAATLGGVVIPNWVYGGPTATTMDARRVWAKLVTTLPHLGWVVWGGRLSLPRLLTTPLRSRRPHGFGQSKPVGWIRDDD